MDLLNSEATEEDTNVLMTEEEQEKLLNSSQDVGKNETQKTSQSVDNLRNCPLSCDLWRS